VHLGNGDVVDDGYFAMCFNTTPYTYLGSIPIDVADRGADNWRERETCPNVEQARKRVEQLTADDTEFFRGVSTPDGSEPRT